MCTKTRKTRKLLLKSGVLLLLRQEGGAVGTPPALGALQGEQEGWRAVARSGAESSAFLVMGGAEWRGVARSGAEWRGELLFPQRAAQRLVLLRDCGQALEPVSDRGGSYSSSGIKMDLVDWYRELGIGGAPPAPPPHAPGGVRGWGWGVGRGGER